MIFDAHADILTHIHECKKKGMKDAFRNMHLDNFKKSSIIGGIFTIWIDPYVVKDTREELIETMANISNEILENSDIFKIIRKKDDLNWNEGSEKIYMIMGIEGLSCIGSNLELIDMLYIYGVRHVSLTWNEENSVGTGVDGDPNRGLTDKGMLAVKKLESLNMIIDLSHANEKTFWDIISHTKGSLIASHSNVRSVCDHKRNLTDEQLKAIANRGGVIGVNIHKYFVDENEKNQNIDRLVDHIDYMKELIGIDHIGFGFDFCEYLEETEYASIEGLRDVSDVKKIIECLERRGYTKNEIEKVSYKNFHRVIDKILE